ncbi:hypothetical protein Poli38472_012668 [Pythium oligandrum]|uniref:Isochorismatase-like domain-containing protein n=1 Tax=Pythium oligandrum TaxID=41045 RepID=A0A8K1CDV7_PYTOL|nr:hypothetical protein Poli38472_012668 [Pythium oligandrum]|eukprot:TMW61477.1 hypothetical protein Poli38472_012668 [Pythium oligandrum]
MVQLSSLAVVMCFLATMATTTSAATTIRSVATADPVDCRVGEFCVSPDPFTAITHQDVVNGLWKPRDETLKDYVLAYTSALESSKKFVLNIWPEHCIIGTPGHNIVSNVHAAALEWAKKKKMGIQYVLKGTNSFTEHYSALRAEYKLSYDPATKLNQELIDNLAKASKVAIVGEALSHCVNYSVRDLVANWPASRRKDLYVFTDCSSAVTGFESVGEEFVADMKTAGLNVIKSTEYETFSLSLKSIESFYTCSIAV